MFCQLTHYSCGYSQRFYVYDKKVNIEELLKSKYYSLDPYSILSFGNDNNLFTANGQLYSSQLRIGNSEYDIYIFDPLLRGETGRSRACGINIKFKETPSKEP